MTLDPQEPRTEIDIANMPEGVREGTGYDRPIDPDLTPQFEAADRRLKPAAAAPPSPYRPIDVEGLRAREAKSDDDRTRGKRMLPLGRTAIANATPPQPVPYDELQNRRRAAASGRRPLTEFVDSETWPPDRAS